MKSPKSKICNKLFQVANVWCAVNVVVKIKEMYEVQTLAVACLASTALASLPSNLFLFSFQVHEKSILLVAIPVAMFLGGFPDCHRRYTPLVCVWFLTVTTASMFPLLQKDQLAIAALALSAFFLILSHFQEFFEPVRHGQQTPAQKGARPSPKPLDKNQVRQRNSILRLKNLFKTYRFIKMNIGNNINNV